MGCHWTELEERKGGVQGRRKKGGGSDGWNERRGPGGREVPNPPWLGGALTALIDLLVSLNLYPQ